MIGNDIVDLQAAGMESNWRRPGYLQKIFTAGEQHEIKEAHDPDLLVWIFWSMKESAYKAHQRKFSLNRIFNPSKIKCTIDRHDDNSVSGKVCIDRSKYSTRTNVLSTNVHTTATASEGTKIFSKIYHSSANIKWLMLREVSAIWDLPQSLLKIEKDMNAIPNIMYKNRITGYPFSISHHGNYTAFSLPLIKN